MHNHKLCFILFITIILSIQSNAQPTSLYRQLTTLLQLEERQNKDSLKIIATDFYNKTAKYPDSQLRFWSMRFYAMTHYKTDFEKSLELAEKAYDFFEKENEIIGQVKAANTLGVIHYRGAKSDIPRSTAYFQNAADLLYKKGQESIGDSLTNRLLPSLLNNLAINNMSQNDFDAALKYAKDAHEIIEKYPNDRQLAMTLMNLGNINSRLGNYEKSIEWQQELLKVSRDLNNPAFVSMAINNIASCYGNQGEMDSAIVYLEQSYDLSKSLKDWRALALRAANLGYAHTSLKHYERAEQYYQEALDLAIEHKFPNRELTVLSYMANSYVKQKRPNEAIDLLNKAIGKAQKMGKTSVLIESYDLLHQAYSLNGNHVLALDFYKKSTSLRDSVKGQEILTKVADFQEKYESEKKEKENLKLQKELEVEQLKTNRRNIAIVSSILILSLLTFAIYLIGRQRQLKAEQNAMINAQKLKRAQINPHFFFNALNSIQSLVATSDNKRQQLSYISKFAKLMRQTLEQSIHEFVPIDEELSTLESYLVLQQLRFKDLFDYTIDYQSPEDESIYIPTQIIQPFIENAIEHGFKNIDYKGQLNIKLETVAEDILKIEITDNGKGIGESQEVHQSRSQTIIKERLELFNDKKKYYFTVENQIENSQNLGVKAVIFTPFQVY